MYTQCKIGKQMFTCHLLCGQSNLILKQLFSDSKQKTYQKFIKKCIAECLYCMYWMFVLWLCNDPFEPIPAACIQFYTN